MSLAASPPGWSVAPARAQSAVDTFRQLKATVRQLGGRRATGADGQSRTQPSPTPPSPAADGADGAMVPASVTVDDASDSALAQTPLVARRVATFDVRGFKLGMSPRELGRVADRQHFRRRWNDLFLTQGTFEVEATRLANFQLNRPVNRTDKAQLKSVQGSDPAGAVVTFEFTSEPSGPKLSRMVYVARLDGATRQQTIDALVAKYGTPVKKDLSIDYMAWSDTSSPLDTSSPTLSAIVDGSRMTLTLTQSLDHQQAARGRLAARAREIAASRGGGVKF